MSRFKQYLESQGKYIQDLQNAQYAVSEALEYFITKWGEDKAARLVVDAILDSLDHKGINHDIFKNIFIKHLQTRK